MTTQKQFLALDIETNKPFQTGADWRDSAPLGIACATACIPDLETPWIWVDKNPDGTYSDQLSVASTKVMVRELEQLAQIYTLATWNGTGFDWPVIAQESEEVDACRQLALNHVDMMFHLFCVKGYPAGLANACVQMGLPSKTEGVDGAMVGVLWAEGKRQLIIDYCTQDSRITAMLATACQRVNGLQWTSRSGRVQTLQLPQGWLSTRDAMTLALPDTSWMDTPMPRGTFTDWLSNG